MKLSNEYFFYEILYNYFHSTALHAAVKRGNYEIIQLLLSCNDIDVNINAIYQIKTAWLYKTPLLIAIEKGFFNIVQVLLQCDKIDVNKISVSLLIFNSVLNQMI